MTTARLTETDIRLRDAITRQLERDSEVDTSTVGVTAKSGAVTLTGYVIDCSAKLAAERAAKRIRGVRAVANDIKVRQTLERTDPEIAADIVKALDLYSTTPDRVQAVVHNGLVTLTGRVAWMFQKRDAEKVVRHVRGVRGVMNYIAVTPSGLARDVHDSIVAVLHRNGTIDPRGITVTVSEDIATLSGTVRTWLQRESAERIAADAPGINRVDNQIVVERLDLSSRDSLDAI
jgi:osmotically-inducible protein OsmY